ncbi:type I-E CRISPR-associated protein Cse1/CasA [Streptococcus pneumoniae]|uniref:type I-E CRISPR-associated protein Cse1/CasA n=1 Tax=Streptococcus pneumoniae TaxID=1313 RepID=UPI001CB79FA9
MLAVLHRALDGPRDIDQWREWWEAGTWDAGAVSTYLDRWRTASTCSPKSDHSTSPTRSITGTRHRSPS